MAKTKKFTTAYGVMIYGFVKELMETEGLSIEDARDRLQREVDEVCDEIGYGDGDDDE